MHEACQLRGRGVTTSGKGVRKIWLHAREFHSIHQLKIQLVPAGHSLAKYTFVPVHPARSPAFPLRFL